MTVCTAAQAIKEAKKWVGYLEKKSAHSLKSKTANAGYNNYTYFGYIMHKAYPRTMDYPAYWCDAFFDACIYLACNKSLKDCSKVLCGAPDDYTVNSAQYYIDAGRWGQTPKKGAQVFFTNNGNTSGICHTGIVVSYTADKITTIEGNTSAGASVVANGGGVAQKSYYRANSRIAGYGYPKYAKDADTSEITGTGTTYKITASALNVRNKRSTVYGEVVGSLKRGATVKLKDVKINKAGNTWGKIASGKYKGFFIAVKFHGNTYANKV